MLSVSSFAYYWDKSFQLQQPDMVVILALIIEGVLIVYCSYTVWISLAAWIALFAYLLFLHCTTNFPDCLWIVLLHVVAMYWEICLMNDQGMIFVLWSFLLLPVLFLAAYLLFCLLFMCCLWHHPGSLPPFGSFHPRCRAEETIYIRKGRINQFIV